MISDDVRLALIDDHLFSIINLLLGIQDVELFEAKREELLMMFEVEEW